MAKKKPKVKSLPLEMAVLPHNGTPEYRQTVSYRNETGGPLVRVKMGGQKLLIFLAVYVYSRFIAPVGRRFGKTTSFPFLVMEESRLFSGTYYAIFIAQSHDKAYEMMEFCEKMWGGVYHPKTNPGGMIKAKVGGPRDQRRFLDVLPFDVEGEEAINDGIRAYFVSGAHPHYKRIRGYPHPMHRAVADEFAQIHPDLRKAIMPMLADCGGKFLAIGTTDEDEIGNDLFHLYYNRGLSEEYPQYGCMNFPSMANPTLSLRGLQEVIDDCIDDDELQQEVYAKFLKGKGSVFSNLPNVICLKPAITADDQTTWPRWVREIAGKAAEARGAGQDKSSKPPTIWVYRDYEPSHDFIMSGDWAQARDNTVFGVYDMTTLEQVALFQFWGDNFTEQFVWAREIKEHYQAHEFHGDENTGAGQSMGDLLRAEYDTGIIPHKFNTFNKPKYVRDSQIIFYESRVKLIDCKPQKEQFKEFKKYLPDSDKGEMRIRYGHPPGKKDDFVDSFMQISGCILDGERPAEEAEEKRGFNMIAPDGSVNMDYWEDNPTDDALEEWEENARWAI